MNHCNFANFTKSPSMPQEVRVETRKLTNFTSNPGKGKGCLVLMRETTNPVCQKKLFTAETRMDLLYSKDNYFFAVQSVSEDGNEGLPVIPVPAGQ
jgi:hypothetical protein